MPNDQEPSALVQRDDEPGPIPVFESDELPRGRPEVQDIVARRAAREEPLPFLPHAVFTPPGADKDEDLGGAEEDES